MYTGALSVLLSSNKSASTLQNLNTTVLLIPTLFRHTEVISCVGMDEGGLFCISGSLDTTAIVWELNTAQDSCTPKPVQVRTGVKITHTFCGHFCKQGEAPCPQTTAKCRCYLQHCKAKSQHNENLFSTFS